MIPDYQRPYSWEQENCEQLWDDIVTFFKSSSEIADNESYFLASLVVHTKDSNKKRVVVDGQQRLTTLALLIRSIFNSAGTITILQKLLRKTDSLIEKKEKLKSKNILNRI